jgi:hypothetical protein
VVSPLPISLLFKRPVREDLNNLDFTNPASTVLPLHGSISFLFDPGKTKDKLIEPCKMVHGLKDLIPGIHGIMARCPLERRAPDPLD